MNNSFLIEEDVIEHAQNICKFINEPEKRNRAMSNVTAAKIIQKYFDDIEVDVHSSICNVTQVLRNIDIADVYINKNYFDVRLTLDEEELYIPKSHLELNILPTAYVFIKITEDLSGGEVLGFVSPTTIDFSSASDKYIKLKESDLVSFYDIQDFIIEKDYESYPENFDETVLEYLDNRNINHKEFYNILLNSRDARLMLQKASNAKDILNAIAWDKNITITSSQTTINDSDENPSLESSLLENQVEFNNLELVENSLDETLLESNLNTENIEELTENAEELYLLEDDAGTVDDINPEEYNNEPTEVLSTVEEVAVADEITDEYNYSTETTPSITELETELNESDLEDLTEEANLTNNEAVANSNKDEEIEQLFNINNEDNEENSTEVHQENSKKENKLLPSLFIFIILGALCYYGYTNFINQNDTDKTTKLQEKAVNSKTKTVVKQEAMPIETVDNTKQKESIKEEVGISLPAIEENLNVNIDISNLNVNWEVPTAYTSSNTAKRYLTKIGKIIQLNLKTELLLLSNKPITDKISAEIEFNKANQKFELKNIVASSGDSTVDELIKNTIKKVLKMNMNMNMNIFNNLAGNPILVIRL